MMVSDTSSSPGEIFRLPASAALLFADPEDTVELEEEDEEADEERLGKKKGRSRRPRTELARRYRTIVHHGGRVEGAACQAVGCEKLNVETAFCRHCSIWKFMMLKSSSSSYEPPLATRVLGSLNLSLMRMKEIMAFR